MNTDICRKIIFNRRERKELKEEAFLSLRSLRSLRLSTLVVAMVQPGWGEAPDEPVTFRVLRIFRGKKHPCPSVFIRG
jgi:hypothetical protein